MTWRETQDLTESLLWPKWRIKPFGYWVITPGAISWWSKVGSPIFSWNCLLFLYNFYPLIDQIICKWYYHYFNKMAVKNMKIFHILSLKKCNAMVSGGRIDHGHHNNTAKRALYETLAFEDAVKTALQMTNSSDTLIVVTADHSHVFNIGGHSYRGNNILGKFISALLFFRLRKFFFWTNWHIWVFNFFFTEQLLKWRIKGVSSNH